MPEGENAVRTTCSRTTRSAVKLNRTGLDILIGLIIYAQISDAKMFARPCVRQGPKLWPCHPCYRSGPIEGGSGGLRPRGWRPCGENVRPQPGGDDVPCMVMKVTDKKVSREKAEMTRPELNPVAAIGDERTIPLQTSPVSTSVNLSVLSADVVRIQRW